MRSVWHVRRYPTGRLWMTRNNADYWNRQHVREYGGIVFAVLFFLFALGATFLL